MNFKAHRIAKALAISGSETLQITWFVAANKFPLWSHITHPTPIISDSLKTAASTFALTQSSGGGTHCLVHALGSHLLQYHLNICFYFFNYPNCMNNIFPISNTIPIIPNMPDNNSRTYSRSGFFFFAKLLSIGSNGRYGRPGVTLRQVWPCRPERP
jgi:hypothetical protein